MKEGKKREEDRRGEKRSERKAGERRSVVKEMGCKTKVHTKQRYTREGTGKGGGGGD